jgi:hypothetical protein
VLVVAAVGAEDLYGRAVGHGQDREVLLGVSHGKAEYFLEELHDSVVFVSTGADPGQAQDSHEDPSEILLHRLQRKARSGQRPEGPHESVSASAEAQTMTVVASRPSCGARSSRPSCRARDSRPSCRRTSVR